MVVEHLEPQRIVRRLGKILLDPVNELWLSPISVGELVVLIRKRRIAFPDDVSGWVAKTIQDLELIEAPITVEVALAISTMNFPHGDPADHFLAATAKVFGLTLVTADQSLMRLPGIEILPNR